MPSSLGAAGPRRGRTNHAYTPRGYYCGDVRAGDEDRRTFETNPNWETTVDSYVPPGLNRRLVVDHEAGRVLWELYEDHVISVECRPDTGLVNWTTRRSVPASELDVMDDEQVRRAWTDDEAWAEARHGEGGYERYALLTHASRDKPLVISAHSGEAMWLFGSYLCAAPIERNLVQWSRTYRIDWNNVDTNRREVCYRAEEVLRENTVGFGQFDERLAYVSVRPSTQDVYIATVVEAYDDHRPIPAQARTLTVPGLPSQECDDRESAVLTAVEQHLQNSGDYVLLTTDQAVYVLEQAPALIINEASPTDGGVIARADGSEHTWTRGWYGTDRWVAFVWRGDPVTLNASARFNPLRRATDVDGQECVLWQHGDQTMAAPLLAADESHGGDPVMLIDWRRAQHSPQFAGAGMTPAVSTRGVSLRYVGQPMAVVGYAGVVWLGHDDTLLFAPFNQDLVVDWTNVAAAYQWILDIDEDQVIETLRRARGDNDATAASP